MRARLHVSEQHPNYISGRIATGRTPCHKLISIGNMYINIKWALRRNWMVGSLTFVSISFDRIPADFGQICSQSDFRKSFNSLRLKFPTFNKKTWVYGRSASKTSNFRPHSSAVTKPLETPPSSTSCLKRHKKVLITN